MRRFFRTICIFALFVSVFAGSAFAADQMLKVGLYYGNNALFSANLQNYRGFGYDLGWFDEETRQFFPVAYLEQEKISMSADGNIYISGGSYYSAPPARTDGVIGGYHVEIDHQFVSYEEARFVADQFRTGFVAFINNSYRVRVNNFAAREEAEIAAATYTTYTWSDMWGGVHMFSGTVVSPSGTGITVTVTTTDTILFEFDCSGAKSLGIMPRSLDGTATVTWFKGYKWNGGFEYRRSTGGNINVINVVNIDDYVKGVLPYEMSPKWPLEALKAQAVCARTYAAQQSKHYKSYRFDVCNTTDCQVYYGTQNASALTDQAAEETSGIVALYQGQPAELYYYSSNGGASENSENVWTKALPYLTGKYDPYEAMVSIPGYSYSVTYTCDQLTRVLQQKGYSIGSVKDVRITGTTAVGNVSEITVTDTAGRTLVLKGEKCRLALSSGEQSVKSMRFTINGGSGASYYVNGTNDAVSGLNGAYAISAAGISSCGGQDTYVITASGVSVLEQRAPVARDTITISGTGSGHNVGMSQYGAKAMAELGMNYLDILNFYFAGIALERVG